MQTFGRENSSRNNHVEEIGRVVPTATGQPERPATVGASSTDTQTFELFFFIARRTGCFLSDFSDF